MLSFMIMMVDVNTLTFYKYQANIISCPYFATKRGMDYQLCLGKQNLIKFVLYLIRCRQSYWSLHQAIMLKLHVPIHTLGILHQ